MTEKGKKVIIAAGVFAGGYAMAKGIAGKKTEDYESLDADNPYIKIYQAGVHRTIYESRIKPVLDRILSFIGLAVLSPVFGVISLAIVATDPGPVFFTQKRVGANGFFMLHNV